MVVVLFWRGGLELKRGAVLRPHMSSSSINIVCWLIPFKELLKVHCKQHIWISDGDTQQTQAWVL